MVKIVLVKQVTNEIFEAVKRLIPQLAEGYVLKKDILDKTISTGSTHLFIAKIDDKIVGTACLVNYYIPTGAKTWIEDVVTDREYRGQGIGEKLILEALKLSRELGLEKVNLTTSPFRESANRLYKRLGFKQRETNVYIYTNA